MTEPDSATARVSAPRALLLPVLLSAWFLAQFDFFVVNVAAPSIQRELHSGAAALEMTVGGYAFAYAAGLITGGRLGDRFGYRTVFVIGVLAFAATSLLCGLAPGPATLVVARLAQGAAGAIMVPQVLALITAVYPPQQRSVPLGWYGAAGGLGSIAGQVLGGLLLHANVFGLGWRVIFLVNVPVALLAAFVATRVLPDRRSARPPHQDPLGATGIAAVLALILVPITVGPSQGWPPWTWLCVALGVVSAALVLRGQRRLAARGGTPVLDPVLFRFPSYRAGIAAITAFMAYFASFMFTLALLLQDGLRFDAFRAGLMFAPMGIAFSVIAVLGPRVRHSGAWTVAGGGIIALGLLLLTALLRVDDPHAATGWIAVALTLIGIGNGFVLPRLIGYSLTDVDPDRAGIGSAVLTTAQQFAGAAGVAVLGTAYIGLAGPTGDHLTAMRVVCLIDTALVAVVTLLTLRLVRHHR